MSDDERNDPFADLDADTDREGDPFDTINELADSDEAPDPDSEPSPDSSTPAESRGDDVADPFAHTQRLSDALDEKRPDDDRPDFDAPSKEEFLENVDEDEIAAAVEAELTGKSGTADETSGQQDDDPFSDIEHETRDIGQQDEEEILESLGDQEGDPFADEDLFTDADVTTIDANRVWDSLDEDDSFEPSTTDIQEDVSKHRFCKQCEYFSDPPASHCTHETAEILQYLDMDTVRVLNCPVVAKERQIENE